MAKKKYSRYYVSVDFDPNCLEEIKEFMLRHNFSVNLVSEVDLKTTPVSSANTCFLNPNYHKLHCVVNSNGKFISREIFDFLYKYQTEIESFQIGSLF